MASYTQTELTFIASGCTILGGLIGGWITHRFSDRRNRVERHRNAYDAFYNSFIKAIQILSKEAGSFKESDFFEFTNLFGEQDTNRIKILGTMRSCRVKKFNKKWAKYQEWQGQCNTYESTVMIIGLESKRRNILGVINDLLDTAKHY